MSHHASLFFPFPDALADAILGALAPEMEGELPKTTGTLARTPEGFRIDLAAEDLPSLRAALNSYLRWVDTAERAARLAGLSSARP